MKTALISVSDKTGVIDFARRLHSLGFTIISTGGTAASLADAGIAVTKVSDVTGFPEILDGRVKTLHPTIHGGLLARPDLPHHAKAMADHAITKIDIVAVNLYPFEQTLARQDASFDDLIENIDIGGPAMVRASAKNFAHTVIITDPSDYDLVASELESTGTISQSQRQTLALKAFSHTAHYDATISQWLASQSTVGLPTETALPLRLEQSLRYGENPHQHAGLYGSFLKIFHQLHGKELSYNNILDVDAATALVAEFREPSVVIVKHNNPCGVGTGTTLGEAYQRAFATDTVSPFGGILAFNMPIDGSVAETVHPLFAEVLIAPSYTAEALELLTKKRDRRLLTVDFSKLGNASAPMIRSVAGGLLVQSADLALLDETALRVVTDRQPTESERQAMMFAWTVAKHVKSNAIVYASQDRTLAIGAGQMSRLDSARIAVRKAQDAGLDLSGCAVASDAFFPFADGLLQAAEAGATCVIQPGGSVRDEEVIAAANAHDIAMIFTGMRHFRH
ncbi:MAG: bifunctional phosphoribosylaminoimidazolecarboxamide formyltransferase/IMP cyclohydrolase [Candidatus Kapabacteria bacterium]|jgi:phosphoribosylaminoimidazolecarboxamide formyltransferase/IMP cyclohydrolase|nr:bifunctional phosphoribosylaminoimidazolecarboxamide formyltransferase/IMP cyclohydrolase [Candidatus Kapabacteria bacterium]